MDNESILKKFSKIEQEICEYHGIPIKESGLKFVEFYQQVITMLEFHDDNTIKIYIYAFIFLESEYKMMKKNKFIRNEFSVKVFDSAIQRIKMWMKNLSLKMKEEKHKKAEEDETRFVCNLYSII